MGSIFRFLYRPLEGDLVPMLPQDYERELLTDKPSLIKDKTKLEVAYEKAWDARKFEIDNYWKRATYFWAFQIAAFAAYGLTLNSVAYNSKPKQNPEILYSIICIGFVTATAWVLTNIGSKFWQRHWEKHLDMLEDRVTGPLYKVVYMYKSPATYSVSKINDIISRFFATFWLVLVGKYWLENTVLKGGWAGVMWTEITVTLIAAFFVFSIFHGYGRGQFGAAEFGFKRRKVFKSDNQSSNGVTNV